MTGMFRLTLCLLAVAVGTSVGTTATGRAAEPVSPAQTWATVNRGTVELVTGQDGDASVRMAREIAAIVDDGATRRVVPVVGKGGVQNIADLNYLNGID